ncbi:enoyl-CoA hydratase/isomerase family protein [Nocardioides sp. cx-173]|uniref:enoyl-CoA hydratase/isomerase family protein n=1 Tax=Nocardioides sp. cx-173 TaxID=2898796 RepID=UPI001E54F30A|nr:enoyl-CoA hydratase/isomerase family protein [Nocardioides sp. cx-173]MCD4524206.1 enoyl-CoA hydratase/isomerase family protein [Nocardioides sp. cx-173]UGB41598.1 enoyl-CoA hydratase/isomerase family protein [Nocardioides sp. cx-173]
MPDVVTVGVEDLPAVLADGLRLRDGMPTPALVVVELGGSEASGVLDRAAAAVAASAVPVVGVGRSGVGPGREALGRVLTTTLVPQEAEAAPWQAGVADVDAELAQVVATARHSPRATRVLAGLLPLTAHASVAEGLTAESLAYSMLMAGPEFARWLEGRARKPGAEPVGEPVVVERHGHELLVLLNRPERHNAFSRDVRDGLAEAFDLVAADPTITAVTLRGAGRSFCSGGDLDEFGLSADPTIAHLIRTDRSVAARLHRVRERVTVVLHGACVGAGIEIASYAGTVVARSDARILLPELGMGLVPGAGGTVGVTRRIGPWRTAYLAMSGRPLPLAAARRWGLVDEVRE